MTLSEPLRRSAPPPLSALSRGRGGHCHAPTAHTNFTRSNRTHKFHSVFDNFTVSLLYSQPQTLNHRLLPANVFPCVAAPARYRGSGSTEPKGLNHSRKAAFGEVESRKVCETAMLILSEPLRLRHLPYPRYRAAEEDIATLQPHTQISQRI